MSRMPVVYRLLAYDKVHPTLKHSLPETAGATQIQDVGPDMCICEHQMRVAVTEPPNCGYKSIFRFEPTDKLRMLTRTTASSMALP